MRTTKITDKEYKDYMQAIENDTKIEYYRMLIFKIHQLSIPSRIIKNGKVEIVWDLDVEKKLNTFSKEIESRIEEIKKSFNIDSTLNKP